MICAAVIILNITQFTWNDRDTAALNRAKLVCSTYKQYVDTPCLKKFTKSGEYSYQAICGEKK